MWARVRIPVVSVIVTSSHPVTCGVVKTPWNVQVTYCHGKELGMGYVDLWGSKIKYPIPRYSPFHPQSLRVKGWISYIKCNVTYKEGEKVTDRPVHSTAPDGSVGKVQIQWARVRISLVRHYISLIPIHYYTKLQSPGDIQPKDRMTLYLHVASYNLSFYCYFAGLLIFSKNVSVSQTCSTILITKYQNVQ